MGSGSTVTSYNQNYTSTNGPLPLLCLAAMVGVLWEAPIAMLAARSPSPGPIFSCA